MDALAGCSLKANKWLFLESGKSQHLWILKLCLRALMEKPSFKKEVAEYRVGFDNFYIVYISWSFMPE